MTITAILAALGGLVALVLGFLGGHKVAANKTAAEVAKAKTVTEAETRATVANETAAAAGQAMADAATIRTETVAASEGKTKEQLITDMRARGEID
jgi:hypothetical protein